jgi:hypothetical protein
MDIDFNESTYAVNFLITLIRSGFGGFNLAPILPTLWAEGHVGGGVDVEIRHYGIPYLFQFKVPDYMVNKTEKIPARFEVPYYRMPLNPKDAFMQHRRLLEHQRSGFFAAYASPWFYSIDELNEYYRVNQVWCQSLIIEPEDIGDLDYSMEEHYVAYQPYALDIDIQSDPISKRGPFSSEVLLSKLYRLIPNTITREQSNEIVGAAFNSLFNIISRDVITIKGKDTLGLIRSYGPYIGYAYLARQYLDCQLLIINKELITDILSFNRKG